MIWRLKISRFCQVVLQELVLGAYQVARIDYLYVFCSVKEIQPAHKEGFALEEMLQELHRVPIGSRPSITCDKSPAINEIHYLAQAKAFCSLGGARETCTTYVSNRQSTVMNVQTLCHLPPLWSINYLPSY
jgi:hypothetical protein